MKKVVEFLKKFFDLLGAFLLNYILGVILFLFITLLGCVVCFFTGLVGLKVYYSELEKRLNKLNEKT